MSSRQPRLRAPTLSRHVLRASPGLQLPPVGMSCPHWHFPRHRCPSLLLCRSGTLLAFPPSRPQRVLRRFFARNAASNGVVVMSFAKEFPPVGQRCGDASVSNALRHEARPMACADRTDPSLSRASAVCARAKGPE
ncbi:hypothetical protein ERJ75_000905400 [Trypanosoma vivax]|nr:hypothetical protein ERJ75_000905400 [Trypanosoma vivax]